MKEIEDEKIIGDPQVYRTQAWLNEQYGGDSRYKIIEKTGKTGWTTIYALTRALQIELGIATTADNFGNGTIAAFNKSFPNGIQEETVTGKEGKNVYGIIQGALWCKGYSTGSVEITDHFYAGTGAGIQSLKKDMGIKSTSSTVTLNVMKALLSMDQFKLVYSGSNDIQKIQKDLNANYEAYIGIIPCDGLYGRSMNKAMVKVLQAVEGLTPSEATGTFGPTTIAKIPIIGEGSSNSGAIKLFISALICNGYSLSSSATWNKELTETTNMFQKDYALQVTGKGDLNTWMSLFLSKGNPDRPAIGCDTSVILNEAQAQALYKAGYRYIGRYLSGTVGGTRSKAMTKQEVKAILGAGLRIFAIFQEGQVSAEKFKYEQGIEDGVKALKAAEKLGIPYGEIIYFAIDYDVMDGEVSTYVIPYFRGIRKAFNSNYNRYKTGVYGARNVCSRVANVGYSVSSFVSDMSTGFSGNMGYKIPENWAFDQFSEYTFTGSGENFALDKDAYSGKYQGFSEMVAHTEENPLVDPTEDMYIDRAKEIIRLFHYTPAWSMELDHEYTIDMVSTYARYKASAVASFAQNQDSIWCTFNIVNGKPDGADVELAQKTINNLDAQLKAAIESGGGISAIATLQNEITNGSISVGIGIEGGNLKLIYQIDEVLWKTTTAEYVLHLELTIGFRNNPATKEQLEYVKSVAYGVAVAPMAILVTVLTGGGVINSLNGESIMNAITRIAKAVVQ